MLAGISTASLYPENTEEVLARYAERRIACTEVFLNSVSEMEPGYLRGLRAVADHGGVQVLAVHPFTSGMEPMLFFSGYQRRFEDGRSFYQRYYEAANILGADILVFHGNFIQSQMEWPEYFDRFGRLMEDAKREGIRLCHENVNRCMGRTPGFFRELSAALPGAEFVFDVKQAVRAGENVMDFAKAMGENLAHVHISDHAPGKDCLPVGKGVFNIPKLLSGLRSMGYDQGVIVELYRENFGEIVELFEAYQQLCYDISTLS